MSYCCTGGVFERFVSVHILPSYLRDVFIVRAARCLNGNGAVRSLLLPCTFCFLAVIYVPGTRYTRRVLLPKASDLHTWLPHDYLEQYSSSNKYLAQHFLLFIWRVWCAKSV